jgi:hypothetical protein
MHLILGRWETFGRRPYFANLTVMGLALDALRNRLAAAGGDLRLFVFLEDRLVFLAEGSEGRLERALFEGRAEAAAAFERRDGKPLWSATAADEEVAESDRERILEALLELPAQQGLADSPEEYPWIGGSWFAGGRVGFEE